APLATVDFRRRLRARLGLSPRVLAGPHEDRIERDLERLAADREVADDPEGVPLLLHRPFHPFAAERDLRVALDVERVGRAKALVASRHSRVDAGRSDLDAGRGAIRVGLVDL